MGEMQFLAATHVTASKYQLKSLEDKTFDEMKEIVSKEKMRTEQKELVDDFLNAARIIVAGTARRSCRMKQLMIDYRFWNLPALTNGGTQVTELLTDIPDVGAELSERLTSGCELSPFEGSWHCEGTWWPQACPCCAWCRKAFSKGFMLRHRDDQFWGCPGCVIRGLPIDGYADRDGDCQFERTGSIRIIRWFWEADFVND